MMMSESEANTQPRWSLWGPQYRPAKPLWALLAVSLIVAAETFLDFSDVYPLYMSVLVVGVSAWLLVRAWKVRALVGLLAIPLAFPWVVQLVGGGWLSEPDALFYVAHSLFAVFVAVAAYTFMARKATT
jgi:hypothetical protein